MIHLRVETSPFEIPNANAQLEFVRIKCMLGFKEKDGHEYVFSEGIIDTGAYVSVISKVLADKIKKDVTGEYMMKGLSSRDECAIPVSVGKATCLIFDNLGNTSGDLEVPCFFAHTAEVPVIIGFAGLLTKFKLIVDYPQKRAILE